MRTITSACVALLMTVLLCLAHPGASRATMSFDQLKRYVKENPTNLKAVYALGKQYEKRRNFETAIRLWRYIIKRKTRAWGVYNRIGRAYLKLARYEDAKPYFDQVLEGDPENRFARKALSFIHRKLGKEHLPGSAPAARSADEGGSREVNKEKGEADFNEGLSLYYSGEYAKALAKFSSALRNEVREPECHYYMGECKLKEADDIDGAIKEYQQCLTMRADDVKSFMGLAFAYGLKGEVPRQIEYFEKVLAQDSNSGEAHFQLSLAYDKVDNSRKTFEHAQKAIKLDPGYKKKLQPLIKNSNVARKIGKIITDVLEDTEDSQLTDEQIERYAAQIGKILGEDNLRADLTSEEGKQKVRSLVGDPTRRKRLMDAFKNRNSDEMKEVFRESDIDVDVDSALDKYKKKGGRW